MGVAVCERGTIMKGIKVIDIGSNPKEIMLGTCELCFSYSVVDNPYMVLEFPDGTQVKCNAYHWSWVDYYEATVANVVDFSAWLSEQELSDEAVEDLKNNGYYTLIKLINEYNFELEEDDE